MGATPGGTEVPRCVVDEALRQQIRAQPEQHRAVMPTGPDAKWRFFWRIGARPAETAYLELNAAPVVPAAFAAQWAQQMDGWGSMLLAAAQTVAEMAAIGFGLARDEFTRRMAHGPHLLAPTGTDLAQHCQANAVFAG